MNRFLTQSASTLRRPTGTGISGAPIPYLENIRVMPLMPISDPKVLIEGFETYTDGEYDIKSGDILVINDDHYPVADADLWPGTSHTKPFYHLIVQDKRR